MLTRARASEFTSRPKTSIKTKGGPIRAALSFLDSTLKPQDNSPGGPNILFSMDNFFLTNLWPGLAVWSLLYISDFVLTMWGARLYPRGANEIVVFEGSYELNPVFQKDVDALRSISPRFILMLVVSNSALAWSWYSLSKLELNLYPFLIGAFVLLELTIHTRHFRNLFLFRAMAQPGLVRGRIEYARSYSLRMSSCELFTFAALYLCVFGFVESSFLLGGTFSCLVNGIGHGRLAGKAKSGSSLAPQE